MKLPLRLYAILSSGFIVLTGFGILSHELAHYVVMQHFGYKPVLHYASSSFGKKNFPEVKILDSLYKTGKAKIRSNAASPERAAFLANKKKYLDTKGREEFICRLAGPLHTIFTGLAGFALLLYRRNSIALKGMAAWDCFLYFWPFSGPGRY